tara:strand:+ start:329 stop:844 length:516 start_codon:yes stop_codon:yes gene_type:complete
MKKLFENWRKFTNISESSQRQMARPPECPPCPPSGEAAGGATPAFEDGVASGIPSEFASVERFFTRWQPGDIPFKNWGLRDAAEALDNLFSEFKEKLNAGKSKKFLMNYLQLLSDLNNLMKHIEKRNRHKLDSRGGLRMLQPDDELGLGAEKMNKLFAMMQADIQEKGTNE